VIAGKVINAQGSQSRFAFARNSPAIASGAFTMEALARAGASDQHGHAHGHDGRWREALRKRPPIGDGRPVWECVQ
jgi:hypothetical protein